ncbi:MAG: hypothetical protein LBF19_03205 [Prevotellaceae bacterium]|nr:hypothetical protein [Prevotellaceae bacterium]
MQLRHFYKLFPTVLLCVGSAMLLHAQQMQWQWAVQSHGLKSESAGGIACDKAGNVYVTGSFADTASFGETLLTPQGQNDIFLAKYNAGGKLLWIKTAGGAGKDYAGALTVTPAGTLYIAGIAGHQAVFENRTVGEKKQQLFIAAYTDEGALLWVNTWPALPGDYITSIAADSSENGYFSGYFGKQLIFDAQHTITSNGKTDAFVLCVDSTGVVQWVNQWGGDGHDKITAMQYVDDRLWLTGTCQSSMTVGNDEIIPSGRQSVFTIRCTADGKVVYAKKVADGTQILPASIRQLSDTCIVLAGSFADSIRFAQDVRYSYGNHDIFVVMTDTSGNMRWVQQAGSYGYDRLFDALPMSSSILLSGMYSGTLFVNNDTTSFHSRHGDLFNLALDYEGRPQWISSTRGRTEQYPVALTHDTKGDVYVAGLFRDTLRVHRSILVAPTGSYNMFFAKLHNCDKHPLVFLNDTVFTEGSRLSLQLEGHYESYRWDYGQATTPTYEVTCGNVYHVRVTDSLHCVYRDSTTIRTRPAKPAIQIRAEVQEKVRGAGFSSFSSFLNAETQLYAGLQPVPLRGLPSRPAPQQARLTPYALWPS